MIITVCIFGMVLLVSACSQKSAPSARAVEVVDPSSYFDPAERVRMAQDILQSADRDVEEIKAYVEEIAQLKEDLEIVENTPLE